MLTVICSEGFGICSMLSSVDLDAQVARFTVEESKIKGRNNGRV